MGRSVERSRDQESCSVRRQGLLEQLQLAGDGQPAVRHVRRLHGSPRRQAAKEL